MPKIKNPNTKKLPNLNWLISPSYNAEEYRALPFDTRVLIARRALSWFNPPHDKSAVGPYHDEWWEKTLNGCPKWSDERTVAIYVSLFPERTKKDWEDRKDWKTIDFYEEVTRDNAYNWYMSLPEHLRRSLDAEIKRRPSGADAGRDSLYEVVFGVWGDRPELPEEPKDALEGSGMDEAFRIEVWREWVRIYDDLQLVEVVIDMASGIQRDRRKLSEALGINNVEGVLPNQSVGLDDVQAATIQWLQNTGETPLEFLANTYRNEELKMTERITAATKLMDYAHRRVPVKQEIEQKSLVPKLDPSMLKGLTAKELDALEKILAKVVSDES